MILLFPNEKVSVAVSNNSLKYFRLKACVLMLPYFCLMQNKSEH